MWILQYIDSSVIPLVYVETENWKNDKEKDTQTEQLPFHNT